MSLGILVEINFQHTYGTVMVKTAKQTDLYKLQAIDMVVKSGTKRDLASVPTF